MATLTSEQREAVRSRSPVLLVSAAAGSGKTSVLIRRVIDLIEKDDMTIGRMLIVTFTRAAAGEMRQRLDEALRVRAADSAVFRREASRVDSAQISTIHVFCQKLVREFFQAADAPPDAQQLDEATGARLQEAAMNEALDEAFEQKSQDMLSLSAKFRDDQIAGMVGKLYELVIARPDPRDWLDRQAARTFTEEDLERGDLAEEIVTQARLLLSGMEGLIQRAVTMANEPLFPARLREIATGDYVTVSSLISASSEGLTALREAIDAAGFPGQVRVSTKATLEEIAYKERMGALRASYKELFKKLAALIPDSKEKAARDMREMLPSTRALCAICKRYMDIYAEKKRELGAVDFSDLEHMTLDILRTDELRDMIVSRFDAVFVDEYQDISGIQESILERLYSGVKSSFLVGDVKQSIYRFRQADPTLFMAKEARFGEGEDARERKIALNRNFRSRGGVISAVNAVFERVMRREATEVEYDRAARLYAGKESENDPETELHIFRSTARRSSEQAAREARAAAMRIQALVGTPLFGADGQVEKTLTYRDFAILLPKSRGVADVVERELSALGVPVYSEDSGGSLMMSEITQILSALRLMDNRFDDISLLSVLRGPVFGFTEGELANIRLALTDRKASFLDALIAASKEDTKLGERCRDALESLERERFLQSAMPLDEYLWDYMERSGLYAFYGGLDGGRLRQANLRMLCHKASEYSVRRGGDLHDFIEHVSGVSAARDRTSPSVISPWEDVVRIMTMHKSKGLEFPVVILLGLSDRLTKDTGESGLMLHPALGIAPRYVNETMNTTRQTLLGAVIKRVKAREEKSERARLLYVAMTRARDKLIMMGHARPGELPESWLLPDTAMRAAEAGSMLDWLGQTACDMGWLGEVAANNADTPAWKVYLHDEDEDGGQEIARRKTAATWQEGLMRSAAQISALAHSEGEALKSAGLTPPMYLPKRVPFKLGVTAYIKRASELEAIMDGGEETPPVKALPLAPARASLLDEQPPAPEILITQAAPVTGAQRGSATHHALALIPLERLSTDMTQSRRTGIVGEALDELTARGVLHQGERELIDTGAIARFLGSDYGIRMLNAKEPKREWAFVLKDGELCESVLQGVIDLCFIEDGKWVLIDYKTDRVSDVEELRDRYGEQLSIYARALRKLTGIEVKEAAVYSLRLGEAAGLRFEPPFCQSPPYVL